LSEILHITIKEDESGKTIYGPQTISQWKEDGFITLSTDIRVGMNVIIVS